MAWNISIRKQLNIYLYRPVHFFKNNKQTNKQTRTAMRRPGEIPFYLVFFDRPDSAAQEMISSSVSGVKLNHGSMSCADVFKRREGVFQIMNAPVCSNPSKYIWDFWGHFVKIK